MLAWVPIGGVKRTCEEVLKPGPAIISDAAGEFTGTEVGATEVRVRGAMVNGTKLDEMRLAFATPTCAVPAVVRKFEGIVAATCAACTRDGEICTICPPGPIHTKLEPGVMFCPATATEVASLPAAVEFGVTPEIAKGEIVNVDRFERAPEGSVICTVAVPDVVNSAGGMVAATSAC